MEYLFSEHRLLPFSGLGPSATPEDNRPRLDITPQSDGPERAATDPEARAMELGEAAMGAADTDMQGMGADAARQKLMVSEAAQGPDPKPAHALSRIGSFFQKSLFGSKEKGDLDAGGKDMLGAPAGSDMVEGMGGDDVLKAVQNEANTRDIMDRTLDGFIAETNEDVAENRKNLSDVQAENAQQSADIDAARKALQEATERSDVMDRTLDGFIAETNEDVAENRKNLSDVQAENRQQGADIDATRKALQEATERSDVMDRTLDGFIAETNEDVAENRKNLSDVQAENAQQSADIDAARKALQEATERSDVMDRTLDGFIAETNEDVAENRKNLSDVQAENRQQGADIDATRKALQEATERSDVMDRTLDGFIAETNEDVAENRRESIDADRELQGNIDVNSARIDEERMQRQSATEMNRMDMQSNKADIEANAAAQREGYELNRSRIASVRRTANENETNIQSNQDSISQNTEDISRNTDMIEGQAIHTDILHAVQQDDIDANAANIDRNTDRLDGQAIHNAHMHLVQQDGIDANAAEIERVDGETAAGFDMVEEDVDYLHARADHLQGQIIDTDTALAGTQGQVDALQTELTETQGELAETQEELAESKEMQQNILKRLEALENRGETVTIAGTVVSPATSVIIRENLGTFIVEAQAHPTRRFLRLGSNVLDRQTGMVCCMDYGQSPTTAQGALVFAASTNRATPAVAAMQPRAYALAGVSGGPGLGMQVVQPQFVGPNGQVLIPATPEAISQFVAQNPNAAQLNLNRQTKKNMKKLNEGLKKLDNTTESLDDLADSIATLVEKMVDLFKKNEGKETSSEDDSSDDVDVADEDISDDKKEKKDKTAKKVAKLEGKRDDIKDEIKELKEDGIDDDERKQFKKLKDKLGKVKGKIKEAKDKK